MNTKRMIAVAAMGIVPAVLSTVLCATAQDLDKRLVEQETKRIGVIEKVKPSVVAIFSRDGQGGGSGVLVTKDGYALTNFHVVEGSGPVMKCGLADGVLYDAVLVGLDKVGDVALIKLLPKEKGKDFPVSIMGDSDKVKAGDWSLAMGNPFLLATDFNPTVTFGIVSGVNRYQYPAGTLLEYTDCIQIDTSINPGNSGGPLYNMQGELIGINGRGSFDKRGRVNSGVGYAISINQIKNFMGHMLAGIDTDHATLGAIVESEGEDGAGNKLVVKAVLDDADVHRRGLDSGDEIVSFIGRPMTSVNQYKNVLGLFPKGWRVPLIYRRDNAKHEVLARLMQLQKQQNPDEAAKPRQPAKPMPVDTKSEAFKLYEPKAGYANYYFNKLQRDRLLADLKKQGDFTTLAGTWSIDAEAEAKLKKAEAKLRIGEEVDQDKDGKPIVRKWTYHLNANTLPALPEPGEKEDELRQAIRKAAALLQKHATSFPQEIFAKDSDAKTKEMVAEIQKQSQASLKALNDGLEELKKAGQNRGKEESRLWQAHYDYWMARLSSFVGYAQEYNTLIGQLAGNDPPKRDPKQHRGWRMVTDDKIQNTEATKLQGEAVNICQKMLKDYEDSIWADRAKDMQKLKIGLRWQPSGGTRTLVHLTMGTEFELDPLKVSEEVQNLKDPPGSGGLLMALYQYRRFLTQGMAGFEGKFVHGGHEPIYPFPADGSRPKSFKDVRIDTEVLHTEHAAVHVKWYFSLKDQTLLAFEVFLDADEDPCEVYLSDYRKVNDRLLPHRMDVRYGNDRFGAFTIRGYQFGEAK